ncbi:MAG: hypothetical protein EP335_10655 [Alphaproteobacteria bacterium]|nr:MAG: hypothetical protein EP335_10655 [Alphaproteobacteria bacterium]
MKRHLATAMCFVFAAAGTSVAANAGDCSASIAPYKDGLPAVEGAQSLSAQAQIEKLTDNFSTVVKAVGEAQGCYEAAAQGADAATVADLKAGAAEVGRVFRLSYSQFESAMEPLTAAAMGEIAPAAGGDGDQVGMDSAMEAVTNSMFVMEWAQKSLDRQAKLEAAVGAAK